MANRIKGITVEIGGDTTKLQNALKGVNTELKNTQAQLKDVDKLLKLDPGNTELLNQKYKLLGQAVDETKQKLETLKTAQQQTEQALANGTISQEQYDALQREIIETEQDLKRLEDQANQSATAMQKIAATGEKLKTVGDNISSAGQKLLPVTAAVTGLGTAAVTTAANFESSMSQVQATMGITKDAMSQVDGQTVNTMDALSELAKKMGSETAFSASECADALNYLALAGYDTQQMCDTLPTVLNLAAAGGIDLASASDMVTDAMSALGMGVNEAEMMVDQMAKTASTTNTSVSQLGEGILTIGATAKSVKGGTAELNTALGILANNGIKGAEGGTHLRNVVLSLQNPTDKAAASMEQLGVDVYDSQGNMRSMNDILGDLNRSMDGMTSADKSNIISNIFNKTDLAAVNSLLANTGDTWDDLQQSIVNSGGAAQQMADTQLDNLQGQITILKSALEGLAISFGELMLPAIKGIVDGIQGFVTWLNSLGEGTKKVIVTVALLVAALGPVLIIVGKVISAVGTIMTIVPKIAGAIKAVKGAFAALNAVMLANPIVLIIAAIAALVAAFIYLWNTNEEFRQFWIDLWNSVKEVAVAVWEALKTFFASAWEAISATAQAIWNGISSFFTGLWEGIKGVFTTVVTAISNFLSETWNAIATTTTTVFTAIQTTITSIWNAIYSVIEPLLTAFEYLFETIWQAIQILIEMALTAIQNKITDIWNAIVAFLTPILESIKNTFSTIWTAITTAISTALTAIQTTITTVWNAIVAFLGQCSVETLGSVFAPESRQASSNYGVGVDGRIGMYCEEKDRSWCSSNAANDHRAITIEVASDTTHPYAVNDKAYAALINLCVDICKRNGIRQLLWKADKSLIGQVDKQNMTVHRWFANKACPGDYLYNRHGAIAEAVNARLSGGETISAGTQASSFKAMSNENVITMVGPLFTADQKKSGVLASVSLAQFILESGYGKSELVQAANNCFGMKKSLSGNTWQGSTWDGVSIHTIPTQEQNVDGSYTSITADFRKYGCVEDSIADHSAYLLGAMNGSKPRYDGLKGCTEYSNAVQIIKDGGYATSLDYVDKLCDIIQRWKLTAYDVTAEVDQAAPEKLTDGYYRVRLSWVDAKSQLGSYKVLSNAKKKADENPGYFVFDASGKSVYPTTVSDATEFSPYLVSTRISDLNIRKGPGTDYARTGFFTGKGVFTIVAESSGQGASKWGKLKSGAGWISLDYCNRI